ncbi:MAG: hypothetical protein ACI3Y0_02065 [Prevotella sp.]
MNRLKRYLIWLLRCRHSRGFGIQSPSDYAFVRYVVNEHYPYYAYSDLRNEFPALDSGSRKLMELYFRFSNWMQPDFAVVRSNNSDVCRRYVESGCKKTKFVNADISCIGSDNDLLFIIGKNGKSEDFTFLRNVNVRSLLVIVEDIYGSNRRLWKNLSENSSVRVSYDLYYVGLATFDKTRYKTNYKINF